MIRKLKGIVQKAARPVSIDDMNAAAPRESWAAASEAAAVDDAGDADLQTWRDVPLGLSPDQLPVTGLREFIAALAARHGVRYVYDGNAALAGTITRLSGDEVVPDETEKLVIALGRAGVIDGPTMVTLLGRYFDEMRAAC